GFLEGLLETSATELRTATIRKQKSNLRKRTKSSSLNGLQSLRTARTDRHITKGSELVLNSEITLACCSTNVFVSVAVLRIRPVYPVGGRGRVLLHVCPAFSDFSANLPR